ncbi:MAG: DOMON domain-containing protein [Pseudomonadota bacterium]
MRRRRFLLAAIAPLIPRIARAQGARRFEAGGMTFEWRHASDRIFVRLAAPTRGWFAVGFNDQSGLDGARFVIASVSDDGVARAEERIARPPVHSPVEALGGAPGLAETSGRLTPGGAAVSFSLPIDAGDAFAADLRPGATTHLMLAWSHEPDFTHHSAWRRHFTRRL